MVRSTRDSQGQNSSVCTCCHALALPRFTAGGAHVWSRAGLSPETQNESGSAGKDQRLRPAVKDRVCTPDPR